MASAIVRNRRLRIVDELAHQEVGEFLVAVFQSQLVEIEKIAAAGDRVLGGHDLAPRAPPAKVSTYAFLGATGAQRSQGTTMSGSRLRWSNVNGGNSGTAPAGTWRLRGYQKQGGDNYGAQETNLWLRIA